MSKKKSPQFQFYYRDFLADDKVQVMTCEEVGAYLLLLILQWQAGHVPEKVADWANPCRLAPKRIEAMARHLEPCFPVGEDGKRRNPRLEEIRADQVNYRLAQKDRARCRWDAGEMPAHPSGICHEDAESMPDGMPEGCSASASAIQKTDISSNPPPAEPPPDPRRDAEKAAIARLWARYLDATKRDPRFLTFTALRRQKGTARLRECLRKTGGDLARAEALMELAIERLAASDWHMGRDPKTGGKRYCEWELHLFPSAEKLEWWLSDDRAAGGAR